jgi:hypothetical protein
VLYVRDSRNRVSCLLRGTILLLATALAACADNAYYLKSEPGAGIAGDLAALDLSELAEHPLQVATTFKSDGKVDPEASTTLYRSIADGLRARGIYRVQRSAPAAGDAGIEIAVLGSQSAPNAAPAASAKPLDAEAIPVAPPHVAPRLLVLVENHPDMSGGTQTKYFFSGFTMGAWSPNKATDRYDVTIAYRDPLGQAHIRHSHQDLILSTGTSLLDRDDHDLASQLRRYNDPLTAFGGVVSNSINGGPGVITVGKPSPGQSGAAPTPPPATP